MVACFLKISFTDIQDFAIDWEIGNWYFIDEKVDQILACSKDGSVCLDIVKGDMRKPHTIVLDPPSA